MAPSGAHRQHLLAFLATAGVVGATRHIDRGAAAAARAGELRTVPALSPESDSRFYRHDYPDDFAPTGPLEKDFDSPHPVMQDSRVYDEDFVKDENSDSGEWRAQTEYDRLRTRMDELSKEAEKTLRRKQELERELEAKRKQVQEVREGQRRLREDGTELPRAADAAHGAEGAAGNTTANSGRIGGAKSSTAVRVSAATKEVERELKDMEECKRQLAEAQAKLDALRREQREAAAAESAAQEAGSAAQRSEAASEMAGGEVQGRLSEASARHEVSLRAYRAEHEELQGLEGRLKTVEARLLESPLGAAAAAAAALASPL
mmetsp:Transcript_7772/g.24749  ORF Transcript_7772/g.24749 Transcript_7772/m.24749 type:complete len:319 (+) Transcript_7772:43-999(+)